MKFKLMEDLLPCPKPQCDDCGLECYPETGETKRCDEELLQSWQVVLSEYAPGEQGSGQW